MEDGGLESVVAEAIVAEFRRQAPSVYFWDRSDEELLSGGVAEMKKIRSIQGNIFEMADRFDMSAVAAVAIDALRTQTNERKKALLGAVEEVLLRWSLVRATSRRAVDCEMAEALAKLERASAAYPDEAAVRKRS